jgi:hypothetical protein
MAAIPTVGERWPELDAINQRFPATEDRQQSV